MKETRNYLLGTEPTETKVFRINNFEPKLPESLNSFTEDDADFVLVFTVDKDDEEYGKKMKARSYYLKELEKQGVTFKAVGAGNSTDTQFILLHGLSDMMFKISSKMSIRLPLKGTTCIIQELSIGWPPIRL